MKITTLADDTAELATRIAVALPDRLHAMRDAMGGSPAAHTYDVVPSPRSVLWCWVHERDVSACQRDDLDCAGETMIVNDPTGEAAVAFDAARRDRAELERCIRRANRQLDRAVTILATYDTGGRTVDRDAVGRCTDCARYCDGTRDSRLTRYRGGDPVCPACRKARDRKIAVNQ